MSVVTKIESPGLARDVAPEIGSRANALRRAENVVIRSPGVVESRPNFDLLYESGFPDTSVRALREFNGVPMAVVKNGSSWGLTNLVAELAIGGQNLEPVSYDQAENDFAEARQNLYITSLLGVGVVESPTSPVGVRAAGISMFMQTDLSASQSTSAAKTSCAYRLVFVRKDSNGYIRRSPPSSRIVCTLTGAPQTFGTATQVYFTPGMQAGDQIEFYRSRSFIGISPRPEHYLATTYTLTAADVALGHVASTITDSTPDSLLGAQLYTDAAQGTATAEKFPPPQAQAIATWQRVMWYGRTKAPNRMVLQLQNLYFAGVASFCTYHIPLGTQPRRWTFDTVGGATVTTTDTSGVADIIGMVVTDALLVGPSVAGENGDAVNAPEQWIKPNTRVVSFVPNTSVTLSQGTYTQNPAATPLRNATQPIMGLPVQPTRGLDSLTMVVSVDTTHKLVTNFIVNNNKTAQFKSGMFITDSPNGPSVNGTVFAANTKIFYADTFAAWYIDKAPLLTVTNCTAYIGDVVTINGVEFYAWLGTSGVPWGAALATYRQFGIGYVDDTTSAGPANQALAIQNLCAAINSHAFQTAGFPRATTIGDVWDAKDYEYGSDGLRMTPGTLATSFLLESDFATSITVKCTSLTAFPLPDRISVTGNAIPAWVPTFTYTVAQQISDDATTPNRVYFSDVDEPESVPLVNYIDIGSKSAPILALVPLRNALLVFKSDGLWRITGSGPSAWSVDPLDMTMQLLRPEAVTTSQNVAYAWAQGGFFEVTESGSRSLSQGKLDVELREHALFMTSNTTHGTWVAGVSERNLILLGVPGSLGGVFTEKVYCFHQSTEAWTEWPVSWGKVAESTSFDRIYQSRPEKAAGAGTIAIAVEVRQMLDGYRGYDRTYAFSSDLEGGGTSFSIGDGSFGTWRPIAGDWLSALTVDGVRAYRRITKPSHFGSSWTLVIESAFPTLGGTPAWQAHEAAALALEWHPTAPAGLPIGALARELQFQLDLRKAPDPAYESSIPQYIAGGSSERDTAPWTLTSNMARVASVQPLRMGVSRQIARAAHIAPYFQTSDIFAIRVVGASIVFEGVSERTRR